jgi:hypothetical protein
VARSVEERSLVDQPRRATGEDSYEASLVDSRQLQSRSGRTKDLDRDAFTVWMPCICTILQYQGKLPPFFIR